MFRQRLWCVLILVCGSWWAMGCTSSRRHVRQATPIVVKKPPAPAPAIRPRPTPPSPRKVRPSPPPTAPLALLRYFGKQVLARGEQLRKRALFLHKACNQPKASKKLCRVYWRAQRIFAINYRTQRSNYRGYMMLHWRNKRRIPGSLMRWHKRISRAKYQGRGGRCYLDKGHSSSCMGFAMCAIRGALRDFAGSWGEGFDFPTWGYVNYWTNQAYYAVYHDRKRRRVRRRRRRRKRTRRRRRRRTRRSKRHRRKRRVARARRRKRRARRRRRVNRSRQRRRYTRRRRRLRQARRLSRRRSQRKRRSSRQQRVSRVQKTHWGVRTFLQRAQTLTSATRRRMARQLLLRMHGAFMRIVRRKLRNRSNRRLYSKLFCANIVAGIGRFYRAQAGDLFAIAYAQKRGRSRGISGFRFQHWGIVAQPSQRKVLHNQTPGGLWRRQFTRWGIQYGTYGPTFTQGSWKWKRSRKRYEKRVVFFNRLNAHYFVYARQRGIPIYRPTQPDLCTDWIKQYGEVYFGIPPTTSQRFASPGKRSRLVSMR